MTTSSPPAGLIGLTPIAGDTGRLIRLGQFLNGNGFSQWEHAFVSLGGGQIIEAEPGGARIASADEYSSVYWCENIFYGLVGQGEETLIANAARKYEGVPYSFADYFALAQRRLHIPGPGLKNYVASTGHMICSQLAARAYLDGGVPLFGEWTGYVTPADLYNLDLKLVKA